MAYIFNINKNVICPDVFHIYILENYSWAKEKIFNIVVNTTINITSVISNTPLTIAEQNELLNLVNVWNCSLDFIDPKTFSSPTQQADEEFTSKLIGPFKFWYDSSSVSNKWLSAIKDTGSDLSKYQIPFKGKISAITYSNINNNVNAQVELYKNNILVYIMTINNSKRKILTNISQNIIFEVGDELSCFLRKTGGNLSNRPFVTVFFNIIEGYDRVNLEFNN